MSWPDGLPCSLRNVAASSRAGVKVLLPGEPSDPGSPFDSLYARVAKIGFKPSTTDGSNSGRVTIKAAPNSHPLSVPVGTLSGNVKNLEKDTEDSVVLTTRNNQPKSSAASPETSSEVTSDSLGTTGENSGGINIREPTPSDDSVEACSSEKVKVPAEDKPEGVPSDDVTKSLPDDCAKTWLTAADDISQHVALSVSKPAAEDKDDGRVSDVKTSHTPEGEKPQGIIFTVKRYAAFEMKQSYPNGLTLASWLNLVFL